MVRELRCAAVVALCSLPIVACSEDDQAPTPREEAPAAPAAESSRPEPPPSKAPEAAEPAPSPQPSSAPVVAPRRTVAAPPSRRPPGSTTQRSDKKGDAGTWEDEVAPPGSEVPRKPKMTAEDPWDQ